VNVSLDGATAGVHDALRGRPGTFDRVVAGLRRLAGAARGTRTSVVAVMALGPGNAGQLEAVARLVSGIGGVRLGILPVHHVVDPGGGRPPETRVRTGSGMQGLSRRLRDLGPLLRGTGSRLEGSPTYLGWLERAFAGEPFPIRCNAGYTSLSVDGAGRVYPCGPFVVAGRHSTMLGARRLRDVWNSPEHRRARREATACRACFWNCQSELSIALPLL
jgi:MoaA/NifB/PqqE/SkfB family radical SAM enzyme